MRRISKLLSAMIVAGCLSLMAAPAHAGWGFSFEHGFWNNHGNNYGDKGGGDKGDKGGGDDDKGGSPSTSSAVPEIDPASIGTLFAIVGGGIALVTTRRRQAAR